MDEVLAAQKHLLAAGTVDLCRIKAGGITLIKAKPQSAVFVSLNTAIKAALAPGMTICASPGRVDGKKDDILITIDAQFRHGLLVA